MGPLQIIFLVLGILVGVALLLLIAAAFLMYFFAYSRELPAYGKFLLGGHMESDTSVPAERVRIALAEETEKYISEQDCEEIRTTSFDGLRLYATLVKGSTKGKKVVVAIHGYHSAANWDFGGMVQFYHQRGYHVLLPDCRGHKRSEGKLVGFGWLDRRDAVTWCRKMARMFGPDAEILLTGVSMGGATVMMASGEKDLPKEVKAIIEDCGYSSAMEQFEYMFPSQVKFLAKPVLFFCSLISMIFNHHSLYKASSVKQLAMNSRPILFFHGEEDDFVPPYMMEKCFEAATGVKDFVLMPVAKHAQCCDVDPKVYQNKISDFLETTVGWDPNEKLTVLPSDDDEDEEQDDAPVKAEEKPKEAAKEYVPEEVKEEAEEAAKEAEKEPETP